MTSTRYLGSITPPPPSISVVTGGGDINTKASTWYFWLVNRCVGGFTKASATSASGVVAIGDRIDITIPSSARTSGSDVREFYVLANTTNNVSTASIIASYPGYTLDGTAQSPNDYSEVLTVLPGSLSVSTDEQLELNKFITLEADLPTGVDLLNGMIRHVDEVGAYLTYNAALDDWYQLFPNTTNPNVGVTTDPAQLGCDRDIRSIAVSAKNQIITPIYGLSGSSRAVPIIIVNTGATAIPQGKPIEAQLNIGGEDYLRYAVFTPRGIVDLTTGLVDTTDQPSIGGSFPGDGQGGAVIAIEKNLDAGKGFWFDIRLSFSPEDLGNQLREGSLVEFYADFSPFNSKLSPDAGVFGDIIGPVAEHGRIVPNGPVLTPVITSRAGKIRGYVFPAQGESLGASDVIGVLSNTAKQNIVLTNNGIAYHAVTTPPTASLRAIISTENGVGEATAFAGSYVVDATKYLTLTIAHPDTVRGDYPDIVGVQQQPAVLNAGKVRVYTRPTGGGSITYFDAVLTGGASDVVQVGRSGGTVVADLPVVDADFGLFTPETYVPEVSTGASVFTSSTIEVAIAYLYEGTMTRVTHDPIDLEIEAAAQGDSSRYVRELGSSIWALFALLDTIGFPLSTVVEAKAMTLDDLAANKLFFIAETEKIYYWNAISTAAANDETIIAVTGIVVGRLIAVSGSGGSNATQIIDANVTLSAENGFDYFVDATAGDIVLTLPEVAIMPELLKHKLIRIDSTANTVTVSCSGTDLLNDSTASTFLAAEVITLSPNKVTGTGYLATIVHSLPISRKRRLREGVTLYVSPLGNDSNSGLSSLPGEALQTMQGVADKINSLEANWFEVYLEPGANIDVATVSREVRFAPSSSTRQRSDGRLVYTYLDFYGDEISPPVLTFNGAFDEISIEGLNTIYNFYSVNFSLTAAATDKAPLLVQGLGTTLNVYGSVVTRTNGDYTFVKSSWEARVNLLDISVVGELRALVKANEATVSTFNYFTLDDFTDAIFVLENRSFLDQNAAITLAGTGKQFTLDAGSVIKDNGIVIPGTEGDIKDSGSSITSYPLPTFRSVDLGTYSVTGTATWNLRSGYGAFDAVITITGGSITLSVTNPPTIDYVLTGVLDIDATLGNIILPVAWTLTPDSADPNEATGVYRFVVRHSVTLATTYAVFSPITGGVSQDVDLGYTASPTNGIVTNTKGSGATIPLADVTNAGLLTPSGHSKLLGIDFSVETLGVLTTGTHDIDWSFGGTTITNDGAVTYTFSNIGTGKREYYALFTLMSGTPTFPTLTWVNGVSPSVTGKTYELRFFTYDGGATIYAEFKQLGA